MLLEITQRIKIRYLFSIKDDNETFSSFIIFGISFFLTHETNDHQVNMVSIVDMNSIYQNVIHCNRDRL